MCSCAAVVCQLRGSTRCAFRDVTSLKQSGRSDLNKVKLSDLKLAGYFLSILCKHTSFEIWSFVNNYIFFFCFLNINQHLWETAAMMFIHIERQKSFRGLISFCPHLFRHHREACLRVSQQKSVLTDKHTPPTAWNEDTASFTQRSLLFAIHRNWKHICHQTPYRHWALPRSYSLHRCRNY